MNFPLLRGWTSRLGLQGKNYSALVCAILVFLLAVILAITSFAAQQSALSVAQRTENNLQRAQRATARLITQRPDYAQDVQQLVRTIDQAINEVTSGGGVIRNQVVRSLGPVTHTNSMRQQERLDIANLSLEQAFKIVDNIERSLDVCWIETAELSPAPQDRWNLILEIQWLTYTDENGR